jgi:alanine racemase
MIDITGIPNVNIEDAVTLVGVDGDAVLTMEEVANIAHSFNYELPCKIARRVPRVYYKNGKEVKTNNYING